MDDECLLNELAYEFTQQLRAGEHPSVEIYVHRYPHLAAELQNLLPTIVLMESLHETVKTGPADASGSPLQEHGGRLGDYRLLGLIGRGGMGVVYEAIQESLSRRVALKVLASSHVDEELLHRFQREAQACAQLHHSNIVPVFEVGEIEGTHYFSMQFIDGQPLSKWLEEMMQKEPDQRSSPAHYQYVASLGKQAAEALAYAHRQGVIHRDIKPHNLLLDTDGTLWLTDFGLAKSPGQHDLTSPGDVVGTLRYLPPERLEGQTDQRGDVYSLGVTLYEMLTLCPAFAGSEPAQFIDRIKNVGPTAPRRIDPQIPRDLETIVLKAMSREPGLRFAKADLLAEDLDRYLHEIPVRSRRLSLWGHTWRWCRRNRQLAAVMGLATGLLVAILVLSLVDSIRIRGLLAETQRAKSDARARLVDSLVSQAHARWMGGQRFGRRFETLELLREARSLADELDLPSESIGRIRNEAIAALCLADEQVAQLVEAFPVGTAMLDFDLPIQRYARGDIDGSVSVHRVSDNQVLARLPSGGPGSQLAHEDGVVFAPDGVHLLQRCLNPETQFSQFRIWDVSASSPRLVFEKSAQIIGLTAFSSDGRHLGVLIGDRRDAGSPNLMIRAHLFEVSTGRRVAPPVVANDGNALVLHPWKPQIAVSSGTVVLILNWTDGTELSRWESPQTSPLAWSPEGRQLFCRNAADTKIHRWDVELQQELLPLEIDKPGPYPITRIVFPKADRFLSASKHRYQVWEYPTGRLLWDSPGGLAAIRFSKDGHLLAGTHAAYPNIRILRLDHGFELRRIDLGSPAHGTVRACITPDGNVMAATAGEGTALLDLRTLSKLALIPGIRLPLGFLPDGSLLTHADRPEGVMRWPITYRGLPNASVTIDRPQSLIEVPDGKDGSQSFFHGLGAWSASDDGRTIATPWQRENGLGANIFLAERDNEYRNVELGRQHDVHFTSVSPDGAWVATGSLSWMAKRDEAVDSVTVWDVPTGRRVKDLLVGEGNPQFSPDGKWIAVTSGVFPAGVRMWKVGTWEQAPDPEPISDGSPVAIAFDAQSQIVALQYNRIRLLVPATGRELAWLSVSEETSLATQFFTPDGTRLVAFGIQSGLLYIWDLRAIRQQLAGMNLDWDTTPSPQSR